MNNMKKSKNYLSLARIIVVNISNSCLGLSMNRSEMESIAKSQKIFDYLHINK